MTTGTKRILSVRNPDLGGTMLSAIVSDGGEEGFVSPLMPISAVRVGSEGCKEGSGGCEEVTVSTPPTVQVPFSSHGGASQDGFLETGEEYYPDAFGRRDCVVS
jgi:hypothetical protein